MAIDLPDNQAECTALAQTYGALAFVNNQCVPVSGKQVKIENNEQSVMDGFEIMNFNSHTAGSQPPMPSPDFLPGAVGNTEKGTYA